MNIIGTIMCAKCGKPIDGLQSSYSPLTGNYTFAAMCHGDVDVCEVSANDIHSATAIYGEFAFKDAK